MPEEKVTLPDDIAAQLADLTFQLLVNCQEKERRLAETFGLSVSEFRCLRFFRLKDAYCIKDLAQLMELTSSRITRIVDGLERKGLVKRFIDPKDRRVIVVQLTSRGREFTRRLNENYIAIHDEILQHIDTRQHVQLIEGMQALLIALNKWMEKA